MSIPTRAGPPLGRGDDVWIVDSAILQRIGNLCLPAAAYDAALTPDGAFVLASTMRVHPGDYSYMVAKGRNRKAARMVSLVG